MTAAYFDQISRANAAMQALLHVESPTVEDLLRVQNALILLEDLAPPPSADESALREYKRNLVAVQEWIDRQTAHLLAQRLGMTRELAQQNAAQSCLRNYRNNAA